MKESFERIEGLLRLLTLLGQIGLGKKCVSIAEAAVLLDMSEHRIRVLCETKGIHARKNGRRAGKDQTWRIPIQELFRFDAEGALADDAA